tara:strand:- start:49 stop:1245 length:1197 start_codon:yes stop_codon:yes gene_type:complete
MGTTSSFFGGGGAVLDAPNQGFVNTIDFAANTQFAMPAGATSVRGFAPRVIPCKANTFFLLEGTATSYVHVSYWSINDSGAATQEAAAIQVASNAQQVKGASANGVDRLILKVANGSTQYLRHIYYNGSTLSTSQLQSQTTGNTSTSTVTCTSDGILMGVISTGSTTQTHKCAVILPDGTTLTGSLAGQMQGGNSSRFIGTGEGIIGLGRRTNQTNIFAASKIYIQYADNATLFTIALAWEQSGLQTVNLTNNDNPPYVLPTKGGAYAAYIDSVNKLNEVSITSYGQLIAVLPRVQQTSELTSGSKLNDNLATDSTFCRQANGTYMNFIGQSSSHYVTFDPVNYSHHSPFGTIRPVGDAGSSGSSGDSSTAIVGKFVISTWYDSTDGDVNIDAWNFKG